ncbi:MAG: polyketide cyclase [Acidobacteria bacterium]|nr:polyketide cyclase [Acidobacteriota bacterium]
MNPSTLQLDPKLDLVFERVVDASPDKVWRAWTMPEHLKKWFTPAPWKTVDCEIDLRPGGVFRTVMQSPEGVDTVNLGCYLDFAVNERLVWTNALGPGFRPQSPSTDDDCSSFRFTATITLEPLGQGTRYRAVVQHGDEAGRQRHEEMGFHDGWGAVTTQLEALAKAL